jgi:hypothetical protein
MNAGRRGTSAATDGAAAFAAPALRAALRRAAAARAYGCAQIGTSWKSSYLSASAIPLRAARDTSRPSGGSPSAEHSASAWAAAPPLAGSCWAAAAAASMGGARTAL